MNDNVYIFVEWPHSQAYMEHPHFMTECVLHPDRGAGYFIPLWIYEELNQQPEKDTLFDRLGAALKPESS